MTTREPLHVLLYDGVEPRKGMQRAFRNAELITQTWNQSNGSGLNLVVCTRHKPFLEERCFENLMMVDSETFPYDAVLINGVSPHSYNVAGDAVAVADLFEVPHDKIIYFASNSHNSLPEEAHDVTALDIHCGNGYLDKQDALKIVAAAKNLK